MFIYCGSHFRVNYIVSGHSKGIELVYAKSLGRYKILFKTSDEVPINRNFTDYIPKSSTYGFP